jgi:hypothetical protein
LELASELKALAAETPDSWWIRNLDQVETDDVVHFMHYVLLMRIYLPFAFQEEPIEADYSSRLACMAACEGVAQRYQFLRQRLPYGFLLAHILDLQAFTATVILLLTTHGPLPADFCGLNSDKVGVVGELLLCSGLPYYALLTQCSLSKQPHSRKLLTPRQSQARIEGEIAQVVKLMSDKANDVTCSQFVRNCVATICSLSRLLQQDDNVAQKLSLKVPLLGKVHIRRNVVISKPLPQTALSPCLPVPSDSSSWSSHIQTAAQQVPLVQINAPTLQTQPEWQSDNFSWSIDNNMDYFIQDALTAEDFDPFAPWQNMDMELPF